MIQNFHKAQLLGLLAACCLNTSIAAADDAVAKGKEIYNGKGACSGCHGMEGKGDGPAGASITPKPRDLSAGDYAIDTDGDGKKGTEIDIQNVVEFGAQKYGGSPFMVGRPDLAPEERAAVAKFVLSLKKK